MDEIGQVSVSGVLIRTKDSARPAGFVFATVHPAKQKRKLELRSLFLDFPWIFLDFPPSRPDLVAQGSRWGVLKFLGEI